MNNQDIIIILLTLIIGFGYLLMVRNYDIYEKEPLRVLILVAIFGGIFSIGSSLVLYDFVSVRRNFLDAIVKIGFIEETSKLLALSVIYSFIKKDFNEIVDGIIYIAAISLGFAVIENIFYAVNSSSPYLIVFQRSVYSVIGHLSFSGYMGIAFYIHKKVRQNYLGLSLSLIIAALAHGFYDGFIFQHELIFFFRFVFFTLIFLQIWLFRTVQSFSGFRNELNELTFLGTGNNVLLYCSKCESDISASEFSFGRIKGGICEGCNSMVFNHNNVSRLLKYFRPAISVRLFYNKLPTRRKIICLDEDNHVLYNTRNKFLSADVVNLSNWLKEHNRFDRKCILSLPFIGFVLKYLGLRHIMDKEQ